MPRIQTQQLKIAKTDCIAKWDWQILSTRSCVMRFMIDADDSQVYLKVVELCLFQSFVFEMHTWPQVSCAPQIRN